jgi:hypothetical protein
MGVVFYRLATAKLPFKGDTAFAMAQSQVNDPPTPVMLARPDLPLWVEAVVARAQAKSPQARFQSSLEFHEALSRSLAGMPLQSIDDGSAPTELMATPTRTPLTLPVLTTGPTVATSPPVAVPPTPAPVPGQARAAAPKPVAPAASTPRLQTNTVTAVIAAVVLLGVLALAGRSWLGSQRSQEPPAAPPPAAEPAAPPAAAADPATNPTTPPESAPPVQVAPPPVAVAPPPVTTAAPPTNPKTAQTKPQPQTPAPGRSTAPPPTVAAPPPPTPAPDAGRAAGAADPVRPAEPDAAKAAPPAPNADDTIVGFSSVKHLAVNGRRTTDRDVLVNFGGGQVTLLSRDGGGAILAIPYGNIRRATYVAGRDPKWDTSQAGPPADLDVGSILRQSRHWLVLQTDDSYAILRLDDQRNVARFLDMLQTRTGIKVERPAPGK